MTEATRVVLLGANGQVGTELRALLEDRCDLHLLTRTGADFSRPETLRPIVRELKPAIIVNAAAYTAVDKAESEPELAMLVNARAPEIIAEEAARCGALFVHYSTDYVFDGEKPTPWLEDDATAPLNVYGRTKLAAEQAIAAHCASHLILRTSWLFAPHGNNFLLTILRLAAERDRLTIVADQRGAPTSARAVARATVQLLETLRGRDLGLPSSLNSSSASSWAGIYHMTCAGETTWHGFAQAIVDEAAAADALEGDRPDVVPIATRDYPAPARRPANSVLDNTKLLRQFGVALPHWRDALRETVLDLRATPRLV
jgi:dTDP-4-dehydrorhamnose reductase